MNAAWKDELYFDGFLPFVPAGQESKLPGFMLSEGAGLFVPPLLFDPYKAPPSSVVVVRDPDLVHVYDRRRDRPAFAWFPRSRIVGFAIFEFAAAELSRSFFHERRLSLCRPLASRASRLRLSALYDSMIVCQGASYSVFAYIVQYVNVFALKLVYYEKVAGRLIDLSQIDISDILRCKSKSISPTREPASSCMMLSSIDLPRSHSLSSSPVPGCCAIEGAETVLVDTLEDVYQCAAPRHVVYKNAALLPSHLEELLKVIGVAVGQLYKIHWVWGESHRAVILSLVDARDTLAFRTPACLDIGAQQKSLPSEQISAVYRSMTCVSQYELNKMLCCNRFERDYRLTFSFDVSEDNDGVLSISLNMIHGGGASYFAGASRFQHARSLAIGCIRSYMQRLGFAFRIYSFRFEEERQCQVLVSFMNLLDCQRALDILDNKIIDNICILRASFSSARVNSMVVTQMAALDLCHQGHSPPRSLAVSTRAPALAAAPAPVPVPAPALASASASTLALAPAPVKALPLALAWPTASSSEHTYRCVHCSGYHHTWQIEESPALKPSAPSACVLSSNTPLTNEIVSWRIQHGLDSRTTCMLRNIPNKYSQKMLIDFIDETHRGLYDFIYLRMDFKNRCNVGYSFINFIEPKFVICFAKRVKGMKWAHFNTNKICDLTYANIQSKEALIRKFRNSSVMDAEPSYRPKIFHSEGSQRGLEQTFPLPDKPKLYLSHSDEN